MVCCVRDTFFVFDYVKHFELLLCMKCAIQINVPFLWWDCQRACYTTSPERMLWFFAQTLSSLFILLFNLVKGKLACSGVRRNSYRNIYLWTWESVVVYLKNKYCNIVGSVLWKKTSPHVVLQYMYILGITVVGTWRIFKSVFIFNLIRILHCQSKKTLNIKVAKGP